MKPQTIADNNSCVIYHDFLNEEYNRYLLEYAISSSGQFVESSVYNQSGKLAQNDRLRKSLILEGKGMKEVRQCIKEQIGEILPDVQSQLAIESFEISRYEIQLTAHNHGNFYRPHRDNGSHVSSRKITFVYYFHSLPKMFTGGQLLFLNNKPRPLIIEPLNNSIVFFNSSLLHAVHPVSCPGQQFEHSRFTINGWVHQKEGI